jgi:hypothetical protein
LAALARLEPRPVETIQKLFQRAAQILLQLLLILRGRTAPRARLRPRAAVPRLGHCRHREGQRSQPRKYATKP